MSNAARWFETDLDIDDAPPEPAAAFVESIAETLRAAPRDKRYDLRIEVVENDD